ncbi:MAG: hypothetical protein J7513_15640 [Solirubrobacteraceae bacterium]|nr:hypothetical protein [Solirubrobacteraceae bacterium]
MLALLATIPLLFAIGFVGGFAHSIRGTLATLTLVGMVFAVPAVAGPGEVGVCTTGCGSAWVAPATITLALALAYGAGHALRNRLEHTAAP